MTVSIVIASWNDIECLRNCINSLNEDVQIEKEIIVVDDFNDNQIKDFVIQNNCRYFLTNGNKGPATAWNIGISYAVYDYCVILNSDTIVYNGFCKDYIYNYEKIGHPCLLGPSGNLLNNRLRNSSIDHLWQSHEFRLIPVDWIGGFCMLFEKKVIDQFDIKFEERYRLFYEDTEFGTQFNSLNIPVYFLNPKLLPIQHIGSVSSRHFKEVSHVSRRLFISKWKNLYRNRPQRDLNFIQ